MKKPLHPYVILGFFGAMAVIGSALVTHSLSVAAYLTTNRIAPTDYTIVYEAIIGAVLAFMGFDAVFNADLAVRFMQQLFCRHGCITEQWQEAIDGSQSTLILKVCDICHKDFLKKKGD